MNIFKSFQKETEFVTDLDGRADEVVETLKSYAALKQQNPVFFKAFTPALFDSLSDLYIERKLDQPDAMPGTDKNNFEDALRDNPTIGSEQVEAYADVADALITGMEIKDPGKELMGLMADFNVGAEKQTFDYTYRGKGATGFVKNALHLLETFVRADLPPVEEIHKIERPAGFVPR